MAPAANAKADVTPKTHTAHLSRLASAARPPSGRSPPCAWLGRRSAKADVARGLRPLRPTCLAWLPRPQPPARPYRSAPAAVTRSRRGACNRGPSAEGRRRARSDSYGPTWPRLTSAASATSATALPAPAAVVPPRSRRRHAPAVSANADVGAGLTRRRSTCSCTSPPRRGHQRARGRAALAPVIGAAEAETAPRLRSPSRKPAGHPRTVRLVWFTAPAGRRRHTTCGRGVARTSRRDDRARRRPFGLAAHAEAVATDTQPFKTAAVDRDTHEMRSRLQALRGRGPLGDAADSQNRTRAAITAAAPAIGSSDVRVEGKHACERRDI